MEREEALRIVVQAGKEGQKELLRALIEEMNTRDLEEILTDAGYDLSED